jgi:hypothetical protein
MTVVQIDCELLAEGFVTPNGTFKQSLLKIAWKVRPKRQRRSSQHMLKT